MAAPQEDGVPSTTTVPSFSPATHLLVAAEAESGVGGRLVKIITETMDHTIVFQTITVGDSSAPPAAIGTSSILNSFISGPSSSSAAGQISSSTLSSAIPTNSATLSMAPLSTDLTLNFPLLPGTITISTDIISSFSTPSKLTSTSTLSTISPPPASVYTTGIYIALGLFLFFGVLCALVTSPAIATAAKPFFKRRTQQPGQ
ncbi:hypothetical protein PV04_07434 [Phialophora macrospora]|uniref:Uncharacterized protein n=1 Tax=Phialophora macrospora TaxID=1851006 RepID=A0A0D2FAX3_9EURO|nr:hypothetical protein PV04_07434 [Phialophora macrospora]